MDTDPYHPPAARLEDATGTAVEEERNAHLRHEVQLRSIGALYWLGAVLVGLVVVMTLANAYPADLQSNLYIAAGIGIGALLATLGWGFRALASWVRWPATAVSAVGLLGFPIGTIIHAWILYLVWCAKGRRVLAPDYADVRRQTPHLRYRRTVGDWIALAVVVGVPVVLVALMVWVGTMLPGKY